MERKFKFTFSIFISCGRINGEAIITTKKAIFLSLSSFCRGII